MRSKVDNGKVNIIGTGIGPGVYCLTLGFGQYLHLYSRLSWRVLEEAFEVGLLPGIPVIIQQPTADLAERIFGSMVEINTDGKVLVVPGALGEAVKLSRHLTINRIPAGGYWRLTPQPSSRAASVGRPAAQPRGLAQGTW